jgi:hypothetical protein
MNTIDKATPLETIMTLESSALQNLIIPFQKLISMPGGPRLD